MPEATIGFDNAAYLREQTSAILDRVHRYGNRLYLEFGGKLLFDYHAARVLPGFDPNVKMRLLNQLREEAEILLCIHAGAIERKKMRADFGITYDADAMKLIDDLRDWGIELRAVVITRFDDQPGAIMFRNKLERRGIRVYTHPPTKGYPTTSIGSSARKVTAPIPMSTPRSRWSWSPGPGRAVANWRPV